ncbi:GNAT family N-acetyltransferase [Sandaracinus amylolyticus]|uniref:Acetyltransferase, GNAT family, potentially associated with YqeK n=1 Tax=Sandaracinus amylolyticus TaxID=927083 RepID=A0A0F6W409_9BACT|nr:GNAT family N-acetyltransferase [Sandaracinus amylolyticus]AKF06721.1 Acetyltransferase, GNAT family, potentially associated with YqeK [Sandaracinus amylolyticus]
MPYPADPSARTAILDLLGSVWPHVPPSVEHASRWGADWCEVSTPFVRWEDARALSLVGVLRLPMRVNGRDVTLAGIHGVCTRAAHRGRGLFRSAIDEALRFAEREIGETAILWTEEPAIYERFGFRRAFEQIATLDVDVTPVRDARSRRLDPDLDEDLALLKRMLASRAPVSDRLATREPGWHFLIDLALHGSLAPALVHLPALDAIVAVEDRGRALRIHDVIAPRIPDVGELVAHLGGAPWGVEIALTCDLLCPRAHDSIPHDATDVLMVRGPLDVPPPFALSSLVRC